MQFYAVNKFKLCNIRKVICVCVCSYPVERSNVKSIGLTNLVIIADIDDCASNPCQHGGICTDVVNAYVCICMPGYTGKSCQTSKDYTL